MLSNPLMCAGVVLLTDAGLIVVEQVRGHGSHHAAGWVLHDDPLQPDLVSE